MDRIDAAQLKRLRDQLEDRARALDAEVSAVDAERTREFVTAQENVEDVGDSAETLRHDEVRSAEEERDAAERRDVGAALQRMDAGRYGLCVDCGRAIPLERLSAQPTALRCIADQERAEQSRAGNGRART